MRALAIVVLLGGCVPVEPGPYDFGDGWTRNADLAGNVRDFTYNLPDFSTWDAMCGTFQRCGAGAVAVEPEPLGNGHGKGKGKGRPVPTGGCPPTQACIYGYCAQRSGEPCDGCTRVCRTLESSGGFCPSSGVCP